ncbi:MAG: tetratricopeptide repeat protein [Myxococcota bacterium]|nr:tetratricopeptide repeat protein [Myxococcota bacterium]
MHRFQRLLILLLLALTLAGCVYRKAIKSGDELYAQGQYEAALQQYEVALAKKPDSEEAQVKVADAKAAVVRVYTEETRAHLEAGDYPSAIAAAVALRDRLPDEAAVQQLCRDVSSASQLAASNAAEEKQWAVSLDLLTLVYDAFSEDRAAIDPEITRVKKTWAGELASRALLTENKGNLGDALLLYSKASELVLDPAYVSKRDELRGRLLDQTAYKVKLEGKGAEFKDVAARLEVANLPQNVKFGKGRAFKEADAEATISMNSPRFTKNRSTSTRTARYKSGTKQVPNPQYKNRQDDVLREEKELARYEERVTKAQSDIARYSDQVAREGDTPGTSTGAEQSLSRARSDLESALRNVDSQRDRVIRAKEQLADTPQTIEEDVYSDLEYTVTTHTITGKSVLKITISHPDGRERLQEERGLGVSASDDQHAAQSIANVPEDPLDLPSEKALEGDLLVQGTNVSWQMINMSLQARRNAVLEQAYAAGDVGVKTHLFVIYILLDPTNVDPQVVSEIESTHGIPDSVRVLTQPVQ